MKEVIKCFPVEIVDSEELWVSETDYDALLAQMQWIEKINTLHRQVEILYVVDGYELTVTWDGVAISQDFKAPSVSEAIALAMSSFSLEAPTKWVSGDRSMQEPVDRQLAAVELQRDALLAERAELKRDAERYRWLREGLVGASFDWDDEGMAVIAFQIPDSITVSANCDKVIDDAMQAAK